MKTEEMAKLREDAYFEAFPVAVMLSAKVEHGLIRLDDADMDCLNRFRKALRAYIPREDK